jgi:transposase
MCQQLVGEAERLLNADLAMTPGKDPRYAFHVTELNYGGIPQRAVVIWSEEMKKRNEKTLDKKIQKETYQAEKDLKRLKRRRFVCVPDAENEAKLWSFAHPHHRLASLKISSIAEKVEKKRGTTQRTNFFALDSR